MLIYLANVLIIAIYSCIYNLWFKGRGVVKMTLLFLATLQLVLMLGLREVNLGSDMVRYWEYYGHQLSWSLSNLSDIRFEIGFKILTKVLSSLLDNPQLYLLAIASLSVLPLGYLAYKYSKMPFFTMLLYIFLGFFAFNFSGLRQSIALGLVMVSYRYIQRGNLIKFLAVIGFAACFHVSAVTFIPAYFIRNFKLTPRRTVLLFLIAIIIFIFNTQILMHITSIFYQNYTVTTTGSYMWMLMSVGLYLLSMMVYRRVIESNPQSIALYNIVGVGSILMLFAPVADNVMRISNYYFIFIILLIPAALAEIRGAKVRAVVTAASLMFFVGVYLYLAALDLYGIVPYKFFWM